MFHNLIFDWSGTLVDDLGPVIEATNVVLGKYGVVALDRESFRRVFRLPYSEFYAEMLPHIPLEELEAHFRPAFDAALAPVFVLPHAREKLDWCKALGIRTFVLTSMDTTAFERQLDEFGLRGHFEATYSGVLDKREVIHQILKTHHLDPTETAFVGDMTHDVETARHGGVSSIAVLTGYNHPEILAAVRPDLTVPDLGVLRGLLDKRRSIKPSPDAADAIEIRHLNVRSHIGVPDEERAAPQDLFVTIRMIPNVGFSGLNDDIAATVDYHAVSLKITALAATRPRKLIETLAVEIAQHLLENYPLTRVAVSIEKKILPNTDCVAVHIERSRT